MKVLVGPAIYGNKLLMQTFVVILLQACNQGTYGHHDRGLLFSNGIRSRSASGVLFTWSSLLCPNKLQRNWLAALSRK